MSQMGLPYKVSKLFTVAQTVLVLIILTKSFLCGLLAQTVMMPVKDYFISHP